MRKHLKHLITLMAAGGLLAGATTASASTVAVSPGGAVTGTAGTSQFVFNTAMRTIVCTGTSYAATYSSGTFTGVTLPFTFATNVELRFTGCRINVGPNVTGTCTRTARLSLVGTTTGTDGVTPLVLSAISCVFNVTGATCSVTIGGSVPGQHNNRNATVTVAVPGQILTATRSTNGSGGTCAFLPNDTSVTFSTTVASTVIYAELPTQSITVT
jgi:hypothetical protein